MSYNRLDVRLLKILQYFHPLLPEKAPASCHFPVPGQSHVDNSSGTLSLTPDMLYRLLPLSFSPRLLSASYVYPLCIKITERKMDAL